MGKHRKLYMILCSASLLTCFIRKRSTVKIKNQYKINKTVSVLPHPKTKLIRDGQAFFAQADALFYDKPKLIDKRYAKKILCMTLETFQQKRAHFLKQVRSYALYACESAHTKSL